MAKRNGTTSLIGSFPPIAAHDALVLVLGSVPSIASLTKRQYYGHPQNAFWPIMGRLFGAGPDQPYERRKQILCAHGVAVWDVLRECYREGSLDADIEVESEAPNDFAAFFRGHGQIESIFFNGHRPEAMFRRHVLPMVNGLGREFRYRRLPSTSPAHAGRSFAKKLAAWRAVARALRKINHGRTENTEKNEKCKMVNAK